MMAGQQNWPAISSLSHWTVDMASLISRIVIQSRAVNQLISKWAGLVTHKSAILLGLDQFKEIILATSE